MSLPDNKDILFVSNGHGEDAIAASILDFLAPDAARRSRIVAWAQVGHGERYKARGIETIGPENHLPSEGFGTVSIGNFIRDLRAGFVGTYLSQARFARQLRGNRQLLVAIGDIVPLMAGALSGLPTIFFSAPKSAHYGRYDGHDALDRFFMKRCDAVLVRDALTANRLGYRGINAQFLGNPMMDGLQGTCEKALRPAGKTSVALLAGSRGDAETNAILLLRGLSSAKSPCHGLIAAHDGFEINVFANGLPNGWSMKAGILSHKNGSTAEVLMGRFADALNSADIAMGMAGTANEQAVGMGLPLIAVPGAGNQGRAFQKMKERYFGGAALSVGAEPSDIGAAIDVLIADPERCKTMGRAGRALMGSPGGSQAIASDIAQRAGWEPLQ